MKVENPLAFRFIMQDDIYLLNKDKPLHNAPIPPSIIETAPVSFNYLGGHQKRFLVIVHYPELEFIADNHLTALQSILKRKELRIDDVAIFNIANHNKTSFADLIDFFSPRKLLLLGERALPAGIGTLPLNKPAAFGNCTALLSFSFDEMMDNTENKKAFWEQVKQL